MVIETEITIKKAKLKDGKLQVFYEQAVEGGTAKTDTILPFPVHPDLQAIYHNLAEHAARIACQISPSEHFSDHAMDYVCSCVSLSGEAEELGVILTAQRSLPNGHVLCYNTPRLYLDDQETYDSKKMAMLIKDLADWRREVKLAIIENKQAPDPQGSLFED